MSNLVKSVKYAPVSKLDTWLSCSIANDSTKLVSIVLRIVLSLYPNKRSTSSCVLFAFHDWNVVDNNSNSDWSHSNIAFVNPSSSGVDIAKAASEFLIPDTFSIFVIESDLKLELTNTITSLGTVEVPSVTDKLYCSFCNEFMNNVFKSVLNKSTIES